MPSIYDVKPLFQKCLRPLSNALARMHVTANQVTISAALLSLLAGAVLALYPNCSYALFAIPVVLFVRMVLNAIDGMLAREHNMQSSLGTYLNELGDVFSDVFLYLPFCLVSGIYQPLIIAIVILGIISEMTGVVALQIGGKRRYDGPMGKSDRAFIFGLIGLLLGLKLNITYWINVLLCIVFALLILTVINRVRNGLKEA